MPDNGEHLGGKAEDPIAVLAASSGDPTANVLALVNTSVKRLDDLREQERMHRAEMDRMRDAHTREREGLNSELRKAETARIDAIRAVDVGAVSRAAEVSAAQATTLANAVAASAEALRSQVALTATASATALAAALEPIQRSIDDLRKTQYEQAGQRAQQTESKGTNQWAIGFALSAVLALITIAYFLIYVATHHAVK